MSTISASYQPIISWFQEVEISTKWRAVNIRGPTREAITTYDISTESIPFAIPTSETTDVVGRVTTKYPYPSPGDLHREKVHQARGLENEYKPILFGIPDDQYTLPNIQRKRSDTPLVEDEVPVEKNVKKAKNTTMTTPKEECPPRIRGGKDINNSRCIK